MPDAAASPLTPAHYVLLTVEEMAVILRRRVAKLRQRQEDIMSLTVGVDPGGLRP